MHYGVIVPNIDVNDEKVKVVSLQFNNGDYVKKGDVLLTVESTKTALDIEAEADGYLKYLCSLGGDVAVNSSAAIIYDTLEEFNNTCKENDDKHIYVQATQKAVEKARELGIDLNQIKKQGIVKESDVVEFFNTKIGKTDSVNTKTRNVFRYDRERVVIIGAGKGAEVVVDILLDDRDKFIAGLVDDKVKVFWNYPYSVFSQGIFEFPEQVDRNLYDTVIISIGADLKSMQFRKKIFDYYTGRDVRFTNAIAASAEIRRGIALGVGNLVGSGVYIGTGTVIGDNNSISYSAVIGHHNNIGSHNLIVPAVTTSGTVSIGSECIIPAGVVFRNRIKIGNRVVVPVGYNVNRDLDDDCIIKKGTG